MTVNTVLTTAEGFMRTSTAQPVMGSSSNYASTFLISSFGRSDSGSYICSATVSLPSNAYVRDSGTATHLIRATTGEMFVILLLLCFDNHSCLFIPQVSILH